MELHEFYEKAGGDYETVLRRLSSPRLIQKFVCKFAGDPSYQMLKEALEMRDIETAFRAAHTLKGTAANLGLDKLADAASRLTEVLRNGEKNVEDDLLLAVENAYQATMRLIYELDVNAQR